MSPAVIIVNWQDEVQTLRCIASVRGWTTLAPGLIVIDNGSTEMSKDTLSGALAPDELICNETNLGYGGGNNRGIQQALRSQAEYILLLNADVQVSEQAATGLIKRLEAHPEISILGPVVYELQHGGERCYIGGRDISRALSTRIEVDKRGLKSVPGYPLHEVDYVPGAVFLARREVFERVGLFDESFFFSGETADLCKRARDLSYRSFVDLEISTRHDATIAPRGMRETLYAYYSLRNRIIYGRKHHRDSFAKHLVFWSAMCMLEFGKAAVRGQMGKARAIALALAHGFVNRSGNQNATFVN